MHLPCKETRSRDNDIHGTEKGESVMLEKIFKLRENNTTIQTEIIAGATTFLSMSYIVFVQPAVLSLAGMDRKRKAG